MNLGETIQNRYQLEEILGQGSMGTTYKAVDLHTQHPVAVKLLHFSRIQEWKVLEMFEREAKVLQQLKHPRIPAYVDYFSIETPSDVQFFLVQEYIEGNTLQKFVEAGWRGNEEEILTIFHQLVEVLDYLHTLQPPIVHRDINPKNIILALNNTVYLVDFGAVQERIRTTFLGGSTIVGTYGYVPFEQFTGKPVPASDYYALGATLLFMLTHRDPIDFPTKELKLDFQPFLHASPPTIHLLEGLLEPSVEKRIASPEGIRAILEGKHIQSPVQPAKLLKPSQTNIKKVVEEDNHIYFYVPKREFLKGIPRLFLGLGLLFATSEGDPGMLLGVFGLYFLGKGLYYTFGQTVLGLTPKWIQVSRRLFGITVGRTRYIPTTALHSSDINRYFHKQLIARLMQRLVLGINYAGKTLEIGTKLTEDEAAWLFQEMKEYLLKAAKSLPDDHRKQAT